MTSAHAPRRGRTLNGLHVLLALMGFFAVVFTVNGFMIYKAQSTFGGLDTADAYRKGLAYNERVAAAKAQAKLGWRDTITYVPETQRLRVALKDPGGEAVSGLTVTAHVQRPATNRFDRKLTLAQTGPGIYEADAAELGFGWWTVDLEARRTTAEQEDAALFESRRRLWIKP
jgi:nitrogen fixation protein FixH